MTDEHSDPTRSLPAPEPTVSLPSAPGAGGQGPAPWVAAPPPPPPGQDPSVPVRDAPPAPTGRPGVGRPRSFDLQRLRHEPVWLLAAAAIVVAYATAWIDAILTAVQHQPGVGARVRLLELSAPGSFDWSAIILLGVALTVVGRHLTGPPRSPLAELTGRGLQVASAAVAGAAILGILVELADFGQGVDAAFTGIIGRLGVLAVAAATAWWAWQEHRRPVG